METKYVDDSASFNYIEFLESKGATPELIVMLQKKISNLSEENYKKLISNLKAIYDLFEYMNLSTNEINLFLENNSIVLTGSFSDIIKMCAVIDYIHTDVIFTETDNSNRIHNYKRLLTRFLLLTKYSNVELTTHNLLAPWNEATKKSSIIQNAIANANYYSPNVSSDKDLSDMFDILSGKKDCIDDFIVRLSAHFYSKYYINKTKKKNESKGSI